MEIIPAINTDDPKETLDLLSKLGEIILPYGLPLKNVQIDINDGTFLGVKTIQPQELSEVNSSLKFDYHLMVLNPVSWIEKCPLADRIIGQIEHMTDQTVFVEEVKKQGIKVGLALDFETNLEKLYPEIMRIIDVILLMAYPAGMGGQEFNNRVYDKIEKLKELKANNNYYFKICLDGGITLDNIKKVKLAGVDEVAIGKRVIEGDIEDNLEKFYKEMN